MAASDKEMLAVAKDLAAGYRHPDIAGCWPPSFDEADQVRAMNFALYVMRYGRLGPRKPLRRLGEHRWAQPEFERWERYHQAHRKALRLLASWLPAPAARRLSASRYVEVVGSAGGRYRVWPETQLTERVVRRGKRWLSVATFCYHDQDNVLPPADVALAHVLLLSADEPAFLAAANGTPRDKAWVRAWMRETGITFRREVAYTTRPYGDQAQGLAARPDVVLPAEVGVRHDRQADEARRAHPEGHGPAHAAEPVQRRREPAAEPRGRRQVRARREVTPIPREAHR